MNLVVDSSVHLHGPFVDGETSIIMNWEGAQRGCCVVSYGLRWVAEMVHNWCRILGFAGLCLVLALSFMTWCWAYFVYRRGRCSAPVVIVLTGG